MSVLAVNRLRTRAIQGKLLFLRLILLACLLSFRVYAGTLERQCERTMYNR